MSIIVLRNIVSRRMPLKFSVAVTMTLVRRVLQTTITSLIFTCNVTEIYFICKKKIDFYQKFTLEYPLNNFLPNAENDEFTQLLSGGDETRSSK